MSAAAETAHSSSTPEPEIRWPASSHSPPTSPSARSASRPSCPALQCARPRGHRGADRGAVEPPRLRPLRGRARSRPPCSARCSMPRRQRLARIDRRSADRLPAGDRARRRRQGRGCARARREPSRPLRLRSRVRRRAGRPLPRRSDRGRYRPAPDPAVRRGDAEPVRARVARGRGGERPRQRLRGRPPARRPARARDLRPGARRTTRDAARARGRRACVLCAAAVGRSAWYGRHDRRALPRPRAERRRAGVRASAARRRRSRRASPRARAARSLHLRTRRGEWRSRCRRPRSDHRREPPRMAPKKPASQRVAGALAFFQHEAAGGIVLLAAARCSRSSWRTRRWSMALRRAAATRR